MYLKGLGGILSKNKLCEVLEYKKQIINTSGYYYYYYVLK